MPYSAHGVRPTSNRNNNRRGLAVASPAAIGLLMAGAAIAAAPVLAEQAGNAREMDDLVVTATRLATPRGELASSVTVITAEEIQRRQYRSVPHALRSVPGLHVVQTGGPGQQTSVFMRGANSNHTLVLIDGVEASDPSSPAGAVDFSNLWLDNVERIEIVRGPQSTLYGSDAMGGIINIITKRGEGPPTARARFMGGSYGTTRDAVSVSGGTCRYDYSLSGSYFYADGFSAASERLGAVEDDHHRHSFVASGVQHQTANRRPGPG